ncbi:MAG: DUF3159 domain-containing protein [Anaerolineales bacterium]|nr:DUF3159 domain-containing protein [Anaerolineales bacterium]MCB8952304.1 DUF3159 domain-containing protein [Ardenticatenales bacterium]
MNKLQELVAEFKTVLGERGTLLDLILPPLLFLLVNSLFGAQAAMGAALALAVGLGGLRLWRRQPVWYALGGVLAVLLALFLVRLVGSAAGFFLPNILSGALTLLITFLSLLVGRPLVAWTSFIARRWPWNWYWHPRVRPAYTEVTWLWVGYFALRLWTQWLYWQQGDVNALAVINLATGWPGTILLLALSYLYGTWRLRQLRGPSVTEFQQNLPPPWIGQRRGF